MGWWALVGTGGPPYLQSVRSWQPHLSRGGAPRPGTQLAVKYQQLLLNEPLKLIWQLYFNFLPLFKSLKLNHMKGTISLFSTKCFSNTIKLSHAPTDLEKQHLTRILDQVKLTRVDNLGCSGCPPWPTTTLGQVRSNLCWNVSRDIFLENQEVW